MLHIMAFWVSAEISNDENFMIERSSIMTKIFESIKKNLPPLASNFLLCSFIRVRSKLIKTIIKFMEKHGEQEKSKKKLKFFRNLKCKRYWRIDSVTFKRRSKNGNFRHFWPFPPFSEPQPKLFLLSYIQSIREYIGALFLKKPNQKFLTKIIKSPLS